MKQLFENWRHYLLEDMDTEQVRKAGLIELFHGMSEEDPQTVHVLVHVHSKESMDKFMQEAGEDMAKSGHILESTEVTFLTN